MILFLMSSFYAGDTNTVTVLWDSLMSGLGCCGVNGYMDFEKGRIPLSCCEGGICHSNVYSLYFSTLSGPQDNSTFCDAENPGEQMKSGCYQFLADSSVPTVAACISVVLLCQMTGVILACCLASRVESSTEWYEMTTL